MIIFYFVVFIHLLLLHREIELPLHDNGMEPMEFLKSMGISLTQLPQATEGNFVSPALFICLFHNLKFYCNCNQTFFKNKYVIYF